MQRRGAKSFVDDLVLSRGVVLSRAAASLRSIETKPFRLADLSAIDGHICRQMSKIAGAANKNGHPFRGWPFFFFEFFFQSFGALIPQPIYQNFSKSKRGREEEEKKF